MPACITSSPLYSCNGFYLSSESSAKCVCWCFGSGGEGAGVKWSYQEGIGSHVWVIDITGMITENHREQQFNKGWESLFFFLPFFFFKEFCDCKHYPLLFPISKRYIEFPQYLAWGFGSTLYFGLGPRFQIQLLKIFPFTLFCQHFGTHCMILVKSVCKLLFKNPVFYISCSIIFPI